MTSEGQVECNGWPVFYQTFGSGPQPLLMIPGAIGLANNCPSLRCERLGLEFPLNVLFYYFLIDLETFEAIYVAKIFIFN